MSKSTTTYTSASKHECVKMLLDRAHLRGVGAVLPQNPTGQTVGNPEFSNNALDAGVAA